MKTRTTIAVIAMLALTAFVSPLSNLSAQDADVTTVTIVAPAAAEQAQAQAIVVVKDAQNENVTVLEATAPAEEAKAPRSKMCGTFWSLVPPIVAIVLALITKEVFSSLFIGVLLGAMFAGNFNTLHVVDIIVNDGLIQTVKDTAGVFIFLVVLGSLVSMLNRTGASAAFGSWAAKHVKSRVGAQLATFLLGVLIFIDDYFNCLTVGSVMMPVTDAKRISRAKLSYLIDATAAPICMIAPISSWAAAVSSYAEGTPYSGLELFCRAIPFNFYSLLTFVFIIGISVMKFDFGPMAVHERNAILTGDLFTAGGETEKPEVPVENARGRIYDLVLPLIILMLVCVFGLVYVGGIYDGLSFVDAFSNTDAPVALSWGGLMTLVLVVIYLLTRRVIGFREAMACLPKGFNAMVPAILILTLATSLKNMTSLLEAREFVGAMMEHSAGSLDKFLPAIIFVVGCILAFATGTSWGTFGILIPIVVSIFPQDSPLLFIGMSACLAGAVCGDHCSPISDTTIMSSAGARCQHLNHVSTQLPYAMAVAILSFVSFLIAGFVQNWFICFPIAVALTIGTLFVIRAGVGKLPDLPQES